MSSENALLPRVWELERSLATAVRVNESLRKQLTATETRLEGVKQQRDTERTSYLNEFDKNQVLIKQLADSQKREVMLRGYLERLACLGNGDMHGNSIGNCIAQEALAATTDLDGLILCHAEEVAWYIPEKDLSTTDSEWAAENSEMCEPLYRAKEQGK